jgi:ATP/ADP translocase
MIEALAFIGIVALFGIVLYALKEMSKPHTNKNSSQ